MRKIIKKSRPFFGVDCRNAKAEKQIRPLSVLGGLI